MRLSREHRHVILWRINLVLFSLPECSVFTVQCSQGRLEDFSFEPDTDTGTDDQRDDVGEEEC